MENHPIPQDITGFQFKLIGDMTIKQFAYLAGGCILAWIIFSLPISTFVRLPMSTMFLTFGISFAFLSIGGRAVDTMLINFLRATFSPTKYVYESPRLGFTLSPSQPKKVEEINFNPQLPKTPPIEKSPLDKKEFDFFHMLSQMLHPQASGTISQKEETTQVNPFIVSAELKGGQKPKSDETPQASQQKVSPQKETEEKLEEQTENLEEQLKAAVVAERRSEGTQSYEEAHKKVLEIEGLLNETLSQKQSLEREIEALKKQLAAKQKDVYSPSASITPKTPNVRTIQTAQQGKTAGLPMLPEFPNIVIGIVKDPRGNPLQNVLVEVKDIDGNPVRAFKTNPLGQFQASTPLLNGTYTIEFEDPKAMQKFDTVKFEAKGDIILPIEVISIDTREELRKSLFN